MLGYLLVCLLGLKGRIFFYLGEVATVTHKGHTANKNTATKQKHLLQIKKIWATPWYIWNQDIIKSRYAFW